MFKNVLRRLRPGGVLELAPGELGTDVLTTPAQGAQTMVWEAFS